MDPQRSLHPNLARVAASYDDVCTRWASGLLTAEQAHRDIEALVARDDEGVLWSIDPRTGNWRYRTLQGVWTPGTPPTYGFATPTPFDVTRTPSRDNPAHQVAFTEVELPDSPGSLRGATHRQARLEVTRVRQRSWILWGALAAALAVIVVLVLR